MLVIFKVFIHAGIQQCRMCKIRAQLSVVIEESKVSEGHSAQCEDGGGSELLKAILYFPEHE